MTNKLKNAFSFFSFKGILFLSKIPNSCINWEGNFYPESKYSLVFLFILVKIVCIDTLKAQTTLCTSGNLALNCNSSSCPSPYPNVASYATIQGRDDNYSVFIGGNLNITGGVELEGKGFVYGNFTKTSSGNYNTGYAGVGSGVVPTANTDFLIIGGNLSLSSTGGVYLIAGGTSTIAGNGNVRVKGTASAGNFFSGNGTLISEPTLNLAAFDTCFTLINQKSQCWKGATPSTNGTYSGSFGTYSFTSTNNAAGLYVFNITTDLDPGYAGTVNFSNFPDNTTILINVDKPGANDNITLNIGSFTGLSNVLRQRIIWNFPDAQTVTITGGAQFWGTIVLPSRSSTLNINATGTNGRIIAGGNVNQMAVGSEFHNYSFQGDLTALTCASTVSTCPISSNVVMITGVTPPTVTSPTGFQECVGGNLTLSVTASGGVAPLSYQWQNGGATGTVWNNISGATTAIYTPLSTTAGTTQYRVLVVSSANAGCDSVYSTAASVIVVSDPVATVSTLPTTVCVGANLTLTANTTGGTGVCTVQWQSNPNGITWTNIAGATSNSLNVNNINSTMRYRVQMNCSGNGCCD